MAEPLAVGVLEIVREADMQATLSELLDLYHVLHFHDIDSRRNRAGLPDTIFPIPPVLHLWELKTRRGRLREKQREWGQALAACTTVDYRVIRPEDLDEARNYIQRAGWR